MELVCVLRTSYDSWSAGTRIECLTDPRTSNAAVIPVTFPDGDSWAIDRNDIVVRRSRSENVPVLNRRARRLTQQKKFNAAHLLSVQTGSYKAGE